ncbi:hypothetical protein [Tolypothrix sp. PCC 7910]|uniref:hypothetical protein n=1 Tax=Tolypothrix sp. PCC 7910 TaxID=2099387 RepID=UPI0014321A06|nr:hypothetical protein [Tolypothrix sp. PCC 7910]
MMALHGYKDFPSNFFFVPQRNVSRIMKDQMRRQEREQKYFTDRANGKLAQREPDAFLFAGIRRLAQHVEQYDDSIAGYQEQERRRSAALGSC